jgi:CRISPR/Cas system CSM-associated protein Csm3 (group 7 of RAMP superfamily)
MSVRSPRTPTRVRYSIGMTVASALHLGAGRGDALVDDLVAHDVRGRAIVPGTALAGALRAIAARLEPSGGDAGGGASLEERLWGSVEGASRLVVDDAAIDLDGRGIGTRTGIAIDRSTGAVAAGALYDHAVIPAGSRFVLELELDDEALEPDVLRLLGVLRSEQGLRLGRATTRGMGRIVAEEEVVIDRLDIGDAATLADRIAGDDTSRPERRRLEPTELPGLLRIEVEWSSPVPVLSRDAQASGKVDALPLLLEQVTASGREDGSHLGLPGSSIKGALRAHAERIVRTVAGIEPSRDGTAADRLAEDQALPLVDLLFGSAKTDQGGRRGALIVHDCLSRGVVDPRELEELDPRAADQRVPIWLTGADGTRQQQGEILVAHHVGIDRWTGGAIAGVLYDVAEARGVEWSPIVLDVDLELLHRELRSDIAPTAAATGTGRAAEGLLVLVLEDLAAGRVPLGGLVTRGRGSVEVRAMAWGPHARWSMPTEDDPDRSPSDGWVEDAGGAVGGARAAWRAVWQSLGEDQR